jgi:Bacterial archaeo-eukaryotic release factor family 10
MPAKIATSIQRIPELLGWLRVTAPVTWRVLTAYLDTSALRAEKQAYLLAFRNGCKAIRPSLQAEEVNRFERAIGQAEGYLADGDHAGPPGIVLFASGGEDYFFAMPLPRRPTDEIAWAERPLLGQLESILDDCARIAVALCDEERTQIFTIRLGAIEEKRSLHDDDAGQEATRSWLALAPTRYVRHPEGHVLRHVIHVTRELSKLLQTRPFDHLLIGGSEVALAALRSRLTRPLKARLAGTIDLDVGASDATVLHAALHAADEIERRTEVGHVEALLDAAPTRLPEGRQGSPPVDSTAGRRSNGSFTGGNVVDYPKRR